MCTKLEGRVVELERALAVTPASARCPTASYVPPQPLVFPTYDRWKSFHLPLLQFTWQHAKIHSPVKRSPAHEEHLLRRTYVKALSHFLTGSYFDGHFPQCNWTGDPTTTCHWGDVPAGGLSMLINMMDIYVLINRAAKAHLPGSYVEAGVWRGGASIFARRVMDMSGWHDRQSYVLDSFSGLPLARTSGGEWENFYASHSQLAVSLTDVQHNFNALGPSDRITFVRGFFNDSAPPLRSQMLARKETISVLRMDGDMFDSTMDLLYNFYDLVDVGGYVIIDDYNLIADKIGFGAMIAVFNFRDDHGITDPIYQGRVGAWWQKTAQVKLQRERYHRGDGQRPVTMERARKETRRTPYTAVEELRDFSE